MRPRSIVRDRIAVLLLLLVVARLAPIGAQTVSGTVRDTLTHRPVRDAIVQLVSADADARKARSATTDTLGRYEFTDVAPGRYLIGFIHPLLDSLGIPPLASEVRVDTAGLRVNLSTPVPSRVRSALCGAASDSGAAIIGVVRNTRHEPVGGTTVTAEWFEMSLGAGGQVSERTAKRSATSLANGRYFICGVPRAGTVFVSATGNGGSTDGGALEIGSNQLAHRDLFLPSSANETASLHGVVAGPDGARIAGAMVGILGGPATRTDEHGAWSIPDAPGGTRILETRAIGYYPERTSVDVVDDAPPIHVTLPTLVSVLDTVRVNAERLSRRQANGFDQRRRSGLGHYFTSADVDRLHPIVTTDLLRQVPGVYVSRGGSATFRAARFGSVEGRQLTMRGTFNDRCAPSVFVDGSYLSDLDADDINAFVVPEEIAAVEVYTSQPLPSEFSFGNIGRGPKQDFCGAIAIWTTPKGRPPLTWKGLALKAGGIAVIAGLAAWLSFR